MASAVCHPISVGLSMMLLLTLSTQTFAARFNPRFLEQAEGIDRHLDLSTYAANDAQQLPGRYQVTVWVNEKKFDSMNVEFSEGSQAEKEKTGQQLLPCFTRAQLEQMQVRLDAFPALQKQPAEACVAFWDIVPGATSTLDFDDLKLSLSFPQAAMQQTARGAVPASRWDEGIPALLFNYDYSGNQNHSLQNGGATNDSSDYLNLRSGMNLGPWRLRNNGAWQRDEGGSHWDNMGTWLTRAIIPLKSQLTLGETSTPSDIFDSLRIRGVLLASDEQMLPDSQRGFAPVVRGIAKSNAEVVIEQNGYVIYRRFVSPGQFEINDLYPTSNSGDLTVTVKEADGSEQKYIQPYAAVAVLQREGHLKFSIAGGQYQAGGYQSGSPSLVQLNAIYGLPAGFTGYGGVMAAQGYSAQALGLGVNLQGLGAVSLDATHATSLLADDAQSSGMAWRLLYAKSFAGTGTSFNLSGYRYSTAGYYSFQEATDSRYGADSDYGNYHRHSQLQVNLNQPLGDYGSVYVNASRLRYWQGESQNISLGYNGRIGRVSWSLAWSANKNPDDKDTDHLCSLTFSLPMGNAWASMRMQSDQKGASTAQAGLNGSLLADRNLNYAISEGYGNDGEGNSGNVSLDYLGSQGDLSAGYSYGPDNRQLNYGARGGVIVHSGGVTLGQPLGETLALISARGAGGSQVSNNSGVALDPWGQAIVPQLTPYSETQVALRPGSLNNQVDLDSAFVDVVPTRGAVVKATFSTHVGYRALLTLTMPGKGKVPFGATAVLEDDRAKTPTTGMVAEEGELYLSGLPEQGVLTLRWGKEADASCVTHFQLPKDALTQPVVVLSAICERS
ncbi:fimbrial assembly protein [Enterobacteriaceae bacterium 89]|nr:fimbrial assembly protein [Enterobacteriaceae bacterium 89]